MKHARTPMLLSLIIAPALALAGGDPPEVSNTEHSLDAMAGFLKTKRFDMYKMRRNEAERELYDNASDAMKKHAKFGPLKERFRALDAALIKAAGGHAAEIWGDGKRTTKVSPDGLAAAKDALGACQSVKADDPGSYKKYEDKLARAKKIEAGALRYAGVEDGWSIDVALELVLCEATVAAARTAAADELPIATGNAKKYTDCGYSEYTMQALKISGSKFGPWQLAGVPVTNGYPMECKKLPKTGKIPADIKKGALREFTLDKGDVLAMVGDIDVQQDGLKIYKLARVRIYSKTTEITTGDCGEKDTNLVCAGSGSRTADAYDRINHYVKRAAVHKGKDIDNCKELLKRAYKTSEEWKDFQASAKKSGDWKTGLKYKTLAEGVLTEDQITGKIRELGTKADEQSRSSYCN